MQQKLDQELLNSWKVAIQSTSVSRGKVRPDMHVSLQFILFCLLLTSPLYNALQIYFDPHNVTFWESLAPELHIFDMSYFKSQHVFSPDVINTVNVTRDILVEGYSQVDPVDWELPLPKMVELIETLHQMNLPITFCFLFDEFWYIFMRLHWAVEATMGVDYKRLPDFWAWRVDPQESQRGWHVHRDKNTETLFTNGMPKTLSVWIPLTDATTANGCMYVLPADRDPTYRKLEMLGPHFEHIAPAIRALPVKAGGALLWNQMVWHWGSQSNPRGTQPRYSLAMEFQSNPSTANPANQNQQQRDDATVPRPTSAADDVKDQKERLVRAERAREWNDENGADDTDKYGDTVPIYNIPLSHPLLLFPFEMRLALIGKQILQYQHMYPLHPDIAELARVISQQEYQEEHQEEAVEN